MDGSTSRTWPDPRSSSMARTLPNTEAADKVIADAQRAVADQNGRNRAAAVSSFASRTVPMAGRSGFALRSCRSATSRIISSSRSRLVFCLAETLTMTVSPPHSSAGSGRGRRASLLHALGLGVVLVDLVDGHDDGDAGRPRVVDGFESLGHDAVVGRDYQHDDVCDPRRATRMRVKAL